jgi:hypothetical protein
MDIFATRREEKARDKMYRALIAGCHKHPAYRYKRKPADKCKVCVELFDFKQQLDVWDEKVNGWWKEFFRREAIENDKKWQHEQYMRTQHQ